MPSRTPGGGVTYRFDHTTPSDTLERLETMDERIESIVNRLNDPILTGIERVNGRVDDQNRNITEIASAISEPVQLFNFFIRTRFFRLLNFFGRWFIYGPDDRIYINNQHNRELVKAIPGTTKTEGLPTQNDETSED